MFARFGVEISLLDSDPQIQNPCEALKKDTHNSNPVSSPPLLETMARPTNRGPNLWSQKWISVCRHDEISF